MILYSFNPNAKGFVMILKKYVLLGKKDYGIDIMCKLLKAYIYMLIFI